MKIRAFAVNEFVTQSPLSTKFQAHNTSYKIFSNTIKIQLLFIDTFTYTSHKVTNYVVNDSTFSISRKHQDEDVSNDTAAVYTACNFDVTWYPWLRDHYHTQAWQPEITHILTRCDFENEGKYTSCSFC